MKANCRQQFSAPDFNFMADALVCRPEHLVEESARDAALDCDRVVNALVDSPTPLPVTPQLYFYVLTRRSLPAFDRNVSDYVAHVLTMFMTATRPEHLTDLMLRLASAPAEQAFLIHAHAGNVSLFLSGIFPEHIAHRAKTRGAPGLLFYEQVGSSNYRLASDHRQAHSAGLDEVLLTVADHFTEVRQGLNRLSDRFLSWESFSS